MNHCSNSPAGDYVVLQVLNYTSIEVAQIAYNILEGSCYIRVYVNNTWSNWSSVATDIPSFYKNYSTLDSLAEAVGGVVSTYVGDLNNLNKTCVVTVNSQTENKPFNDGFVMTVFYSAGFLFQIGVDLSVTYIKVRTKWSNTWREWKSVTLA